MHVDIYVGATYVHFARFSSLLLLCWLQLLPHFTLGVDWSAPDSRLRVCGQVPAQDCHQRRPAYSQHVRWDNHDLRCI